MLKGAKLKLMIGPAIPVAVSDEVLDALTSIEVITNAGNVQSGFRLTFNLNNRSPLHTIFLLSGGAMIPVVRVVIIITIRGSSEVIIDGVMLKHQVSPGNKAGHSTLTVDGIDLTAIMDISQQDGFPFPALPPESRVLIILAKYAVLGIIPLIIPPVISLIQSPLDTIPKQKGTDLEYIRLLAKETGYVFYLDPGPAPGTSVAYWGPEIRAGKPQPALNLNMGVLTNVENIDFTFDKEKKEIPVVFIQNKETKVSFPVPIPDISPLNPPLGLIPPLPPKIKYLNNTAKMSAPQALMQGLAYSAQHGDAVSATGSLDVNRYGQILKARRLVAVRGAGTAYNGLYYVNSVTHRIKRGEYKQSFNLVRNGLVSTIQNVAE